MPEPNAIARSLVRSAMTAALATRDREARGDDQDVAAAGYPLATLVAVATLPDGAPILLISTLARHTRNLARDPRCSLLFRVPPSAADPMTEPRISVVGQMERVGEAVGIDLARRRFVARHPGAEQNAGFGDFGFWRLKAERAHLVAGFGRIVDVPVGALAETTADAAALIAAEPEILEHMRTDHADAVQLYAGLALGDQAGEGWRMCGIDPGGLDLVRGQTGARLAFKKRVRSPSEARAMLASLARRARSGPAEQG